MSAPTGWICGPCRRQLHSASLLLRPRQPIRRRGFVSLADLADEKGAGKLETRRQDAAGEQPNSRKATILHAQGAGVPKRAPDEFLEELFKSTGRDPPSAPLHLRYSQRLTRLGGDSQPRPPAPGSSQRARTQTNSDERGLPKTPEDTLFRKSEPTSASRTSTDGSLRQEERTSLKDGLETSERDLDAFVDNAPSNPVSPRIVRYSNHRRKEKDPKKALRKMQTGLQAKNSEKVAYNWKVYQRDVQQGIHTNQEDILSQYTSYLSQFVDGNYYNLATEVWNAIQKLGVAPSLKHWSLMLELARKERERDSLESIWAAMHNAGVLPDNVAWITYISALGRESSENMMRAFDQLEDQWKSLKGSSPTAEMAPKEREQYTPSIFPYNAALEAVVFKRTEEYLHEILSRIDRLEVQPNVDTYNILLKRATAVRDSSVKVDAILQQMSSKGIEADEITVGALINGILRRVGDGSGGDPSKIERYVADIFDELDELGMTPAPHTYSTALAVLLRGPRPNVAAAGAVMAHMADKNIEPSPHVYTILIGHHYNTGDVRAADELLARATSGRIRVDDGFYDRVISGLVATGEVDRLLDCLARLRRISVQPGWFALERAVRALAAAGRWEHCRELVEDVERRTAARQLSVRMTAAGEGTFLATVEELRESGVLPPRPSGEKTEEPTATEGRDP